MELTRQLLASQLNGGEATAKEQQRIFELEQEALAAADVLQQVQRLGAEKEKRLLAADSQLTETTARNSTLERRCLTLQAELHGLQAAAEEWREREDELMLQLLNAANAKVAAEKTAEQLQTALDASAVESARLGEKAETARAELHEARLEAEAAREKAASASLSLERAQLQADQDTLALQRQAASSAEEQLERIRALQAELSATRDEQGQERAAHANKLGLMREEVKTHGQMRGEINMQLDRYKEQHEALTKHNEILSGLRKPPRPPRTSYESLAEGAEPDGQAAGSPQAEQPPSPPPAAQPPSRPPGSAQGGEADGADGAERSRIGSAMGSARTLEHAAEAQPPAVVAELAKYERRVNEVLEMNRGLVEAYWRVRMLAEEAGRLGQPLSLPGHEELSLQASSHLPLISTYLR